MKKRLTQLLAATLLMTTALSAAELSASDLDKRRKALADALHDQWEYTLRTQPEFASILGDKRYNDQVSDASEAAVMRDLAANQKFLKRFEAIGTVGFTETEKMNKRLMVEQLKDSVEDVSLKGWEMPETQMSGVHLFAPQLASLLSFTTVKDYDDYIKRLHLLPHVFDQVIVDMRSGMKHHLMPPKFLLEKVAAQSAEIASQTPEQSPFAMPLQKFPDGMSEADKTRVKTEMLAAIRTDVIPMYQKFEKFVREEYAPAGRTEVGLWSLPDGAHRYAVAVKRSTTTNMTPDQIHKIGLSEVARIEAEMLVIAKELGFNDLKSLNASIETNPDLKAKSREQILAIYRKYEDQMYAKLPDLFGRLPKAKLEVVPIESFREKSAAAADYNTGAPDGSRPGRINVNTSDPASRKTITMESTAYHEGVPGHHMQLSIQQELTDLPPFRQQGGYTAYVEGWALYSERLGKEVGFYQNPYNNYGRLQDEMLRAIRLVVDTGLHSKKWTRAQVVQFFHDHSAIDEVDVQNETDRYIVWPSQALGYKVGQMKITELREKARKALGDKFDIREYHDQVLGAGALPMNVLEERIDSWIASKK